ncbi:phosphopantetheine-binding protein [Chitinivorax sp. B]|uniref:acyl carrier protein n=1 Tax=Chitinivorax sp. B TaxID=2502235 RepID=UPI0010F48159|nr:phosphopantetheine-binding protein [Chitinivorax sp. B]
MSSLAAVKAILADTLQLGSRVDTFELDTPLLGSIPELDSIAVINLITAMEEQFGFTVSDDEISADTFASVGSLVTFVDTKSGI